MVMFHWIAKIIISTSVFLGITSPTVSPTPIVDSTPTPTAIVSPRATPTPKLIIKSQTPTPTPSTQASNRSSAQDIADMTAVIDKVLLGLALDSARMADLMNKMNSDYQQFSPYLANTPRNILGQLILHIAGKLSVLSAESNNYQKFLIDKRTNIINSGYVDDRYWLDIGIPEMVNKGKIIKQNFEYYETSYYQFSNMVPQAIAVSNQTTPSQTLTSSNPVVSQFEQQVMGYNQKLDAMKTQLLAEYKAAGGYWTESQLEYNAMQKLKNMGIKPPTSPYGKLNVPNYNSVNCTSNPSGGLSCVSTSGNNTGQQIIINPVPGGGYNIQSY